MQGSTGERISAFFLGGQPRLKLEEVVYTPGDRFRLQTTTAGVLHLRLGELAQPGFLPEPLYLYSYLGHSHSNQQEKP